MKIKTKPISILATLLIASFFFVVVFPTFKSEGGTLTATYLYLSRIKANLNGAAGNEVEMILAFAPSQNFSTGTTVEIFFSPAGVADIAAWCRTVGSITATGVTAASPYLATTDYDIDAALPGTLSASCAQGTGGAGDSITITGVTALTGGTTYGVKLENGGTGVLGTSTTPGSKTISVQVRDGTNLDGSTFAVYILSEDTVTVTAEVADVPAVDCSLTPTTVSMGILYPGGVLLTELVTGQLTTGSSTGVGYYWAAYGRGNGTSAGLYNSVDGYLIASSATTVDLSAGNSEGFGITVDPPIDATVPTDFQSGTLGQFGGLVAGTDGARLILYKSTATPTAHSADITYGARASTLALSGTYTEYVTYVCGGYY